MGSTVKLTASVNPSDATFEGLSWKSSGNGIATVSDGVVTGVKVGTVTVSVTSGGKSATKAFEGSGVLDMDCSEGQSIEWFGNFNYTTYNGRVDGNGNRERDISKHVQNRICSAFTRHCFVKQGNDYVNYMGMSDTPLADVVPHYYAEAPANTYSGFFHKAVSSIDGYSYGFCYDDNHDQSTTTQDSNVYGCVVSIGRW